MKKILYILILLVGISACSVDENKKDGRVEIPRLESVLLKWSTLSPDERAKAIDSLRPGLEAMSTVFQLEMTDDSVLTSVAASPAVRIFGSETLRRFPSLDSLEEVVGDLFNNIKEKAPELKRPVLYTIVSPRKLSIYNVDSVMLIALNHYLGPEFEGYEGFPPFERAQKRPEMIPYDITEAILGINYPYKRGANPTVLSRLLYEGAMAYAKSEIVPKASPENILGYNGDELKWLEENEENIWNQLINSQLLYSKDPQTIERLVLPSPATTLIHPDAPGRAGRYIGYRIVCSYMKNNPGKSVKDLLSPEFYDSSRTLPDSKYSPR